MSNIPIIYKQLFTLEEIGIPSRLASMKTLSMQSDRYISVIETNGSQSFLNIVKFDSPKDVIRKANKADAAIINPKSLIIALRAASAVQIFNFDTKESFSHDFGDTILFWKWVSETTLAVITTSVVYHWELGAQSPKAAFRLTEQTRGCQILDYSVSENKLWAFISGLSKPGQYIVGSIQLHSFEKGVDQMLAGFCANFTSYLISGAKTPCNVFSFATKDFSTGAAKISTIELDAGARVDEPKLDKWSVAVKFPSGQEADFPLRIITSPHYGLIFLITKAGFLHIFDIETGFTVYISQISKTAIFASVPAKYTSGKGFVGVNSAGSILSVEINEDTIVGFINTRLRNTSLALRLASRAGLKGVDGLFIEQFKKFFQSQEYKKASLIVARSPGTVLRNTNTLTYFKKAGMKVLMMHFSTLLEEVTQLNEAESLELVRIMIGQNKTEYITKWIEEGRLAFTEKLGDILRAYDVKLGLAVYLRAGAHDKVCQCFVQIEDYKKVFDYAKAKNYRPRFQVLLKGVMKLNPAFSVDFARMIVEFDKEMEYPTPSLTLEEIFDILSKDKNNLDQLNSLMVDLINETAEDTSALQTKILEFNIKNAPNQAEKLIDDEVFTDYDRAEIAYECEQAGLYAKALLLYTDIQDVLRVIPFAYTMPSDFVIQYFEELSDDHFIKCLREMMNKKPKENIPIVVQIAVEFSSEEKMRIGGVKNFIKLFEKYNSNEGLFYYLGSIVYESDNPEVTFKYIKAAASLGKVKELEHICRTSDNYDPEAVKDLLMSTPPPSHNPLIIVCDRFGFIEDMTKFLYKSNSIKYIETYIQEINPAKSPIVIGTLIDLDSDEEFIQDLLLSIRNQLPVHEMAAELEKRNRLKILLPILEKMVSAGDTQTETHTILAKIYIDTNKDPETFLRENEYYDKRVIGAYCEKIDPYLALICYKKGFCDKELIKLTNENNMFKEQAQYLVKRQDFELWSLVLSPDNEHRDKLIKSVNEYALPRTESAEEVSTTVKAFMNADLPEELMNLLEKIMLEGTRFSDNPNLQNLLLLTAIRADRSRLKKYIERLDNFNAIEIAEVARENELYEEAFMIYRKFDEVLLATRVLVDDIKDMERAKKWAEMKDIPAVWSIYAEAELKNGNVVAAIDSYIRANDPENHRAVIVAVHVQDRYYEDLVRYLKMCRKLVREQTIETELAYAYAKLDKLGEIEQMLSVQGNLVKVHDVGIRCFNEKMYRAAKIFFESISNYTMLATTLIKLNEYAKAVETAKKASKIKTWKMVAHACIAAKEFALAQVCGLNIIQKADELEELISYYENRGYFNEIIELLQLGIGIDNIHNGVFTALAILYSKYQPEKLYGYIKDHGKSISIPRLIRQTETLHQWRELSLLYTMYNELENSIGVMIDHPVEAWDHDTFRETIKQVKGSVILFRAIKFYFRYKPMLLDEILSLISGKIDASRVVAEVREMASDRGNGLDGIALIKPFLLTVQPGNIYEVNEALNELYVNDGEYENLRISIDTYDNFDKARLAKKLEENPFLSFRKLSSYIYLKMEKYETSIEVAKKDKLWKDAIETARLSQNKKIVRDLLEFFVEEKLYECFTATLYTCYSLIKPEQVLRLSWMHGIVDYTMPFMIQKMHDDRKKIKRLERDVEALRVEKEQVKEKMNEEKNEGTSPMDSGFGQESGQPFGAFDEGADQVFGESSNPASEKGFDDFSGGKNGDDAFGGFEEKSTGFDDGNAFGDDDSAFPGMGGGGDAFGNSDMIFENDGDAFGF